MSRYRWLAAGVALALSVLIACADATPHRSAPGPDVLHKGARYVAMGDSYTSAPDNGPESGVPGCFQTATNYPHQVAKRLGLHLTDVSCGGAMTTHVTRPQPLGPATQPAQADALSRTTDLVTISLGANDFGMFSGVVFGCVAIRAQNPAGAPCAAANAAAGPNSVERGFAELERRLITIIQLVKERSPKARIVVVGYPQFFPEAGPCAPLPLAAGDFRFAYRINTLLVQAQKNAAEKSKVDYVDVFTATKGHDMCADDPWIAGLKPGLEDAMFYHPYPAEQRVVADLLVGVLKLPRQR